MIARLEIQPGATNSPALSLRRVSEVSWTPGRRPGQSCHLGSNWCLTASITIRAGHPARPAARCCPCGRLLQHAEESAQASTRWRSACTWAGGLAASRRLCQPSPQPRPAARSHCQPFSCAQAGAGQQLRRRDAGGSTTRTSQWTGSHRRSRREWFSCRSVRLLRPASCSRASGLEAASAGLPPPDRTRC